MYSTNYCLVVYATVKLKYTCSIVLFDEDSSFIYYSNILNIFLEVAYEYNIFW